MESSIIKSIENVEECFEVNLISDITNENQKRARSIKKQPESEKSLKVQIYKVLET